MQIYDIKLLKVSKTIIEKVPNILTNIDKTINMLQNESDMPNNLVITNLIKDLNNHKWVLSKQLESARKCLETKGRIQ